MPSAPRPPAKSGSAAGTSVSEGGASRWSVANSETFPASKELPSSATITSMSSSVCPSVEPPPSAVSLNERNALTDIPLRLKNALLRLKLTRIKLPKKACSTFRARAVIRKVHVQCETYYVSAKMHQMRSPLGRQCRWLADRRLNQWGYRNTLKRQRRPAGSRQLKHKHLRSCFAGEWRRSNLSPTSQHEYR
jgi:hypothetical protein